MCSAWAVGLASALVTVRVGDAVADFVSWEDGELVVTPANRVAAGSSMTIVVRYRDTPSTHQRYGKTEWARTADGVVAIGVPHNAPWWYPANEYPPDSYLWTVVPADPGPGNDNFHTAVYYRGAFTLQALRVTVGDGTFVETLRSWVTDKRGGNASTDEFVAHADRVAGRQLDDLFRTWLFTSGKPAAGPNDPVL